jgi:hypothetical protein
MQEAAGFARASLQPQYPQKMGMQAQLLCPAASNVLMLRSSVYIEVQRNGVGSVCSPPGPVLPFTLDCYIAMWALQKKQGACGPHNAARTLRGKAIQGSA